MFFMFRKRKRRLNKFAALYKNSNKNGKSYLFLIKDKDVYGFIVTIHDSFVSELKMASMPIEEFRKYLPKN